MELLLSVIFHYAVGEDMAKFYVTQQLLSISTSIFFLGIAKSHGPSSLGLLAKGYGKSLFVYLKTL